jgi:hypothetical protein
MFRLLNNNLEEGFFLSKVYIVFIVYNLVAPGKKSNYVCVCVRSKQTYQVF